MPDHGERTSEVLERTLERTLEVAAYGELPASDYGSALLSPAHVSGGRKFTGGIMFRANYKGLIVNLRAPKWTDNTFWIKAVNYEAAQYIADAVNYHVGRDPFHFRVIQFRYPPLCLSNRDVLTTREMCSAYVGKIAKGPALSRERGDYRVRVIKLVLKAVNGPEAVKFLKSLHAIPRSVPNSNGKLVLDGNNEAAHCEVETHSAKLALGGNENANGEEETYSAKLALDGNKGANREVETLSEYVDASDEHGTPMEVDTVSEEAILSLSPAVCVDPTSVFHITGLGSSLFWDFDTIRTAFVPSFGFGMDLDEFGNIENQGLGVGYRRLKIEYTIPTNLEGLLNSLDEDEEKIFRSTEWFDPETFRF